MSKGRVVVSDASGAGYALAKAFKQEGYEVDIVTAIVRIAERSLKEVALQSRHYSNDNNFIQQKMQGKRRVY